MEIRNTKERIMDAALTLFSEKGYDGVSVDQIAEAAGMKGSSIYRHFRGKEDLFRKTIAWVEAYYAERFEAPAAQLPLTMNDLMRVTLRQLDFTLYDPTVVRVRRLLVIEQFRDPDIARLNSQHTLDGLVQFFAKIFAKMMEAGELKQDQPQELAFEYIAPISLLIQLSDREPARENEVMLCASRHIRRFIAQYQQK